MWSCLLGPATWKGAGLGFAAAAHSRKVVCVTHPAVLPCSRCCENAVPHGLGLHHVLDAMRTLHGACVAHAGPGNCFVVACADPLER